MSIRGPGKAHQLLVEIDHTDYIHALNQAKANLLSAKAKVVQQDAAVRNAALRSTAYKH